MSKVKISKNWRHRGLVQMDFEVMETPIKQLMDLMPGKEFRTEEEESLYLALKVIHEFINKNKEE